MCNFKKYIVQNTWYLGYQVHVPGCLPRQMDSFVTSSIRIFEPAKLGQMHWQDIYSYKSSSSSLQEKNRLMKVLPSSLFHCAAQLSGCEVMISKPLFTVIPLILHQINLDIKKSSVIFEGIFSLRLHSTLISLCHSPIH